MPFRPVLELTLAHPYPASGALPGGMIAPDAATAALLRGLRLIPRPMGERFTIFAEFDAAGLPAIVPPAPVELRFGIARPGGDLAVATDATALGDAPLFTDDKVAAGDPQPLKLAKGKGFTDRTTLASVRVQLKPNQIAAAAAGTPRRCTIALPAASARWCYHLVTDLQTKIADWTIVRAGGVSGPAPAFADAGRVELATDDDAGDAIGTILRRLNPGRRVLRFVSTAPFAASATPVHGLELRAGAARLFASLPNPSPARVARVGDSAVFGRVLRIVTS